MPLTDKARQQWRDHALKVVAQVDQILQKHGCALEMLPPATRAAYRFVQQAVSRMEPAPPQTTDTAGSIAATAPNAPDDPSPPPPGKPRQARRLMLTGLRAYAERVLVRLDAMPDEKELLSIREALATTARRIDAMMRANRLDAAEFTSASRDWRGWAAFFARDENLSAYISFLRNARPPLEDAAARAKWRAPLHIQLRPMRGIYHAKHRPAGTMLHLPSAMVSFDADAVKDLCALILHSDPGAKRRVVQRMVADEYQEVESELRALGGEADEAAGAHHDLSASFDRVNNEYFVKLFGQPLDRPRRLVWSRTLTRRKLGHYDWIGDTIMLSRTLDRDSVPQFVVDYIMYHEMLHKYHGIRWRFGRGYAHTADFYRDEKKFPQHAEAEEWIKRICGGD